MNSRQLKVLSVFGTRPEAIKMSPVLLALSRENCFLSTTCVTGQHREMLDQVLTVFGITPDYDLDLMRSGQSPADVTAAVLKGVSDVLEHCEPDIVLVHGDTATTLAASLAAYFRRIPLGHVEAGLRTGNIYSPWPEEANRRIAGTLATIHFAPTEISRKNLENEGVRPEKIVVTGNTVIDALLVATKRLDTDESLRQRLDAEFTWLRHGRRLVLVTGHRRENFGDGFKRICQALALTAQRHPEVDIVYPVHLNPNVRGPVVETLGRIRNVHLIAPLEYISFVYLMSRSHLVVTDSGGIQEEAPSLGKPVLLMRDTTERPEAVAAGTVKMVGTDLERISGAISELLTDPRAYDKMSCATNPYGDGNASAKIVKGLMKWRLS